MPRAINSAFHSNCCSWFVNQILFIFKFVFCSHPRFISQHEAKQGTPSSDKNEADKEGFDIAHAEYPAGGCYAIFVIFFDISAVYSCYIQESELTSTIFIAVGAARLASVSLDA
jgi:hypothetical protein